MEKFKVGDVVRQTSHFGHYVSASKDSISKVIGIEACKCCMMIVVLRSHNHWQCFPMGPYRVRCSRFTKMADEEIALLSLKYPILQERSEPI